MSEKLQSLFLKLGEDFFAYLPSLIAGIIMVVLGWIIGWITKKFIIRISVLLKLERFWVSTRWGKDFLYADVRYGFYNFIGNIVFLVVFLIFLSNAFSAWKMTILSDILEKSIFYFPIVVISAAIFILGWFISGWAARGAQRLLEKENLPRPTLIARCIKSILLTFFSAMALVELNIAREIVIIGFTIIFVTLGVLIVIFTIPVSKQFAKKILDSSEQKSESVQK